VETFLTVKLYFLILFISKVYPNPEICYIQPRDERIFRNFIYSSSVEYKPFKINDSTYIHIYFPFEQKLISQIGNNFIIPDTVAMFVSHSMFYILQDNDSVYSVLVPFNKVDKLVSYYKIH